MTQSQDHRRENLRKLAQQWDGPTALARKLGYTQPSFLVQMIGPHPTRDVSERTARRIEKALDLPTGWLDRPPGAAPTTSNMQLDTGLLARVVSSVSQVLEAEGTKVPAGKFADIVTLVYAEAARSQSLDADFVRRLVLLAK